MSRQSRQRGIEIPEEVAAAAAIPEDLDANVHDAYSVPNPAQRRQAARVYVIGAGLIALGIWAGLPSGMWVIVGLLLAIAGYSFLAGWDLQIREGRALEISNRAIGFPVGHASANLGFRGWRGRPVWNVLVFSADEPPSQRGLVRVDGIDGSVVETYSEAVPPEER